MFFIFCYQPRRGESCITAGSQLPQNKALQGRDYDISFYHYLNVLFLERRLNIFDTIITMAFLQLESNNPKFSFLIGKNPVSGMVVKSLRHGLLFGYYTPENETQFNCWFKDSATQVSYDPDQKFEFNDVTRYSAASFVNNCFDELFHELNVKDLENDIEGFDNALLINCIRAKQRGLDIFARSFRDFQMEYQPLVPGFFQIRIRTKQTLRKLLCFAGVITLINAIQNREFRNTPDDILIKYAKFIQFLDAPYFVRYQFKANLIHQGAVFDRLRQYLDTEKIRFTFGHNFSQRIFFIEKNIVGSVIIDIGCGEGKYLRFASKAKRYYAIDRDEECREKTLHRAAKLETDKIIVLESLDELPIINEQKTVLLTEVIEHNTPEQALELLRKCLLPKCRIIVTTPNKDFNIHYDYIENDNEPDNEANETETSFRHHEHLFELTEAEFKEFIAKATENIPAQIQFYKLGDCVDGVTPQSAAIIDVP
jgi:SAM-dependent methyltransferase